MRDAVTLENNFGGPQNVTQLPCNSAIPLLGIYILKTKTCAQIPNRKRTVQTSINHWMDKQKVVYPCNGMLFGNKKEWSIDTCYNLDELWKQSAKWKKPDTKGTYYLQCPE